MRPRPTPLSLLALTIAALGAACGIEPRQQASRDESDGSALGAAVATGAYSKVAPPAPSGERVALLVEGTTAASEGAHAGAAAAVAMDAASPEQRPRPGATGASGATQASDSAAARMIIRTGHASVEVDSLERAIATVQALAVRLGGWVGNSTLSSGSEQNRSASIELKIPSQRYQEALTGLEPIGRVESVSSSVEDVGEEFVDLSARMENARRLEERLISILATRAGKLTDVLAVERELARVREEIERHEGRLRFLKARAAVSTLVVTVHEPLPIVGTPGDNPIGDAFRQMWRNFVGLTAVTIASLGVIIPVGVVVALAWLVVRRWRRGLGDGGSGAGVVNPAG